MAKEYKVIRLQVRNETMMSLQLTDALKGNPDEKPWKYEGHSQDHGEMLIVASR